MAGGTGGGRDASGQYVRTVEQAERDAEAARLKAQGWSYSRLAERYKITKRGAMEMVRRAYATAGQEDRQIALAIELAKLDAAEAVVLQVLATHHVTVSNGRLVMDPSTGDPLPDDAPLLAAVDRWLRIAERRSRLMGLDAPARSTVTVITEDVVDAEIARLSAELERRNITAV